MCEVFSFLVGTVLGIIILSICGGIKIVLSFEFSVLTFSSVMFVSFIIIIIKSEWIITENEEE